MNIRSFLFLKIQITQNKRDIQKMKILEIQLYFANTCIRLIPVARGGGGSRGSNEPSLKTN